MAEDDPIPTFSFELVATEHTRIKDVVYKPGDRVTDPEAIAAAVASSNHYHFTKVAKSA